MGNAVIDLALERLRAEGIAAGEAMPGRKAPVLTAPAAAVSVHGADWRKQTVTLSIRMLCPDALGLVRCQNEALRAGNILVRAGARCTLGKSSFDGLSRVHIVELLAVFTGNWRNGNFQLSTGTVGKLVFKTFTWPENPENYREELVREPIYVQTGDQWVFQGMGEPQRVITGSGTFYGPNAAENFKTLAALFSAGEAGPLTHPVWGTKTVYFTGLELTQSVEPEYVAYSFEFREADLDENPSQ